MTGPGGYPVADIRDLIAGLPLASSYGRAVHGELADWTLTDENIARLVDADRTELQFDWTKDTTPPSKVRKQKHRPPAHPPITPYAARPGRLHQAAVDGYLAQSRTAQQRGAGADRAGLRPIPIEELAGLI